MVDADSSDRLALRCKRLDAAIEELRRASRVAHITKVPRALDAARQVLGEPGGPAAVRERIVDLSEAGVFRGSDWDSPESLLPALAQDALTSADAATVAIEVLSELRFLAIAEDDYPSPPVSADRAHSHLVRVVALNLAILYGVAGEAAREQGTKLAAISQTALHYVLERLGFDQVIDELIAEIWRILEQRPIQVAPVRGMVTQIAHCLQDPAIDLGGSGRGAERLVSSLYGPTRSCSEDPGVPVYAERLQAMDSTALQGEVMGLARSMHDTGLVSPYHAVAVRHLLEEGDNASLLPEALGLSSTGRDCLLCYQGLVHALIREAIHPSTCQALYGLALLLERGIMYQPPVAPALWRQLKLQLAPEARERLRVAFGDELPPEAQLIAGVLSVLGQPLGIGQGNNPTCQSARALSMWAYNDPDYLLQMVVWGARDDEIIMHFEGEGISSREGVAARPLLGFDLDAVSLVVVPHLDRIYNQMMARCADRAEDPHRWVNPEFHGWSSGRGFQINVDIASGKLWQLDDFLRHFFASYHPYYNGNQPLIHPQPAGVAVTDSAARFVGWHAITILRVTLDQNDEMRVYFYNPNNDGGQDWGDGTVVSTSGHGERFGESSLPFSEFASRLYIFHFDPLEPGEPGCVEQDAITECAARVRRTWGADRLPDLAAQAVEAPTG